MLWQACWTCLHEAQQNHQAFRSLMSAIWMHNDCFTWFLHFHAAQNINTHTPWTNWNPTITITHGVSWLGFPRTGTLVTSVCRKQWKTEQGRWTFRSNMVCCEMRAGFTIFLVKPLLLCGCSFYVPPLARIGFIDSEFPVFSVEAPHIKWYQTWLNPTIRNAKAQLAIVEAWCLRRHKVFMVSGSLGSLLGGYLFEKLGNVPRRSAWVRTL